jgi:hypothetical protein
MTGAVVQGVDHLLCKHGAQSSNPSTIKNLGPVKI